MSTSSSQPPLSGGRPKRPLLLAGAVSVLGGLLMMSPSLLLLRGPRDPAAIIAADVPGLDRGAVARGQVLFAANCTACHGVTGAGVQGLGKDLTHSDFIAGCTDAQLVAFLKVGRDAGDPGNTTRVAMPPKGGNPALTEASLNDLVAYMRSMQSNAGKRR